MAVVHLNLTAVNGSPLVTSLFNCYTNVWSTDDWSTEDWSSGLFVKGPLDEQSAWPVKGSKDPWPTAVPLTNSPLDQSSMMKRPLTNRPLIKHPRNFYFVWTAAAATVWLICFHWRQCVQGLLLEGCTIGKLALMRKVKRLKDCNGSRNGNFELARLNPLDPI